MDESEYREQLNLLEEQLASVYRERRKLTEAYAEEHPAVLPPATRRTEKQRAISRCPRCSGPLLSENDGAKK